MARRIKQLADGSAVGSIGVHDPLQQLLENQASGHYQRLPGAQGITQRRDLGYLCRLIATKGQRPNTRIDEQAHRERDAL